MKRLEELFSTYQLPLFLLLTYLLSWISAPFMNGQLLPHGPAFAAVIVLAVTTGLAGLWRWLRRNFGHTGAWYWYMIGPAIIIVYQGVALILNLILGASIVQPPGMLSTAVLLELLLLGGLWEEPGWTGYALPKLQERFSGRPKGGVLAVLVLGLLRAIWHLPLALYGYIYWFDVLVFAIAMQIIIAWLYHRSGGSLLVVMWFHFMSNILGAVFSPVFAGVDRMIYYALFMGLAALFALVILKFSGPAETAHNVSPRSLEQKGELP